MWELDHKEGWALKNWCFQSLVLKKTLESPLESKGIKSVNPKGNQSWIFIGRTNAEVSILWPPDGNSQLIGKDPDARKDWGQEEKGTTEDKMVGWHHRLIGHRFGWTPVVGDGQGGLVCYGSWGHKESDVTERLNWTELNWTETTFELICKHLLLILEPSLCHWHLKVRKCVTMKMERNLKRCLEVPVL